MMFAISIVKCSFGPNYLLMKLVLLKLFTLSLLLFIGVSCFAQEERTGNDTRKDSLEVVVPTSSHADIKMLVPPVSFEPETERFNGYFSHTTGAAIVMTMINNVNYLNLAKGMTEEWFANNGFTLLEEKSIVTDSGYKGRSYKCSYVHPENKEVEMIRYQVYIGDLQNTLWLSITYSPLMEELLEDEILKSFQTVNLKPE